MKNRYTKLEHDILSFSSLAIELLYKHFEEDDDRGIISGHKKNGGASNA